MPLTLNTTRWAVGLVLGVIMLAIGLYVAARPLWSRTSVLNGPRWLDMAFAAVFMLRGIINIRIARERRRSGLGVG
jgi:hypothetical protein